MPTYVYVHESMGEYPYPPLAAKFSSGDEVNLAAGQVPRDGRWRLKETAAPPPVDASSAPTNPAAPSAAPSTSPKTPKGA